jgi:voltage-gated potassium channel
LALLGIFVIGAGGYVVLADAPWGDAAYMTLITLSTVGFKEAMDLGPTGRVWTAVVIVFGVGVVSVAYASLLTLFVGGEIRDIVGRRRVQSRIAHLRGHTILCGFGRMGALAARMLKQDGAEIVVVEAKKTLRPDLEAAGLLFVIGDATEEETLQAAGLARARALVSALPSDADNVYVTLTARSLHADLHIVTRAQQPATEHKLRRAGADRVVCPQVIGAKRIADILMRPHVVDFFEVAARGVELEMDDYQVGPDSVLCNRTLRESKLRQRTGAMVAAITRADGTSLYQLDPDEVIREGDRLILIGRAGTSNRLEELSK